MYPHGGPSSLDLRDEVELSCSHQLVDLEGLNGGF